ncbi:MAG TPA: helix-turn-helix domain-containing protein [Dehalococcoidia bacterium]|nr:helix-turn-helix domain-containing protein [Dehalococcoidia bacterium]
MAEWFDMLAKTRQRLALTQAQLAARAHISAPSLKSYESGRRHPSRPYLTAILDALKVDRMERNRILGAAGYATDSFELGPWPDSRFMFSTEEATAFIELHRWPAFLTNEMMEVVGANAVAQRLWGVDLDREFLDVADRNLLAVASDPRFADRCANLPEILDVMAAILKGHHRGPEAIENPSPHFASVLQRFLAGDPKYIQPFLKAWQEAEPRTPKIRWEYPVVWSDPLIGKLRFTGIVNPASEPDGLAFNDWIPLDAATWSAVERLPEGPANGLRNNHG